MIVLVLGTSAAPMGCGGHEEEGMLNLPARKAEVPAPQGPTKASAEKGRSASKEDVDGK